METAKSIHPLTQPVAELSMILEGKYSLTRRCSTCIEHVLMNMVTLGINMEQAHIMIDDVLDNIEFDDG